MKRLQGHIPVLDGIRGLAILMVLIAHFNGEAILKEYFPLVGPVLTKLALTGLMGVDLFFILSGFLITGILVDAKGSEGFFSNFFARRVLRIFPLYYGVLFVLFWILPTFISFDAAARDVADNQWWLWTYLSNFPSAPHWDQSEFFHLGHFWSLAVEEHFYLVWPFIVYSASSRQLKRICLAWIGISIAAGLSSYFTGGELSRFLRWSTLSLSGGLTLGAYCALVAREKIGLVKLVPFAKNMVIPFAIVFLILGMVPRSIHPNLVNLLMHYVSWVFFVSMLILVLNSSDKNIISRIFCSKPMIYLGKLSYGLYVYHGILRPVFETYFDRGLLIEMVGSPFLGIFLYFGLSIGFSFLMAWLSWHLYEKHFLKLKKFFPSSYKVSRKEAVSPAMGSVE